jgi:hypothetical protein
MQQTCCNAAQTNHVVSSNCGLGFAALSGKQTYPTNGESSAVLTEHDYWQGFAKVHGSFLGQGRTQRLQFFFIKLKGKRNWKFPANPFCNLTRINTNTFHKQ